MSGGVVGAVLNAAQVFAEAVVAAGAVVLNSILDLLAGPGAANKVISQFSTESSYLYDNDSPLETGSNVTYTEYVDSMYDTREIALRSLILGTNITDETFAYYDKLYTSHFNLNAALSMIDGSAYVPQTPVVGTTYSRTPTDINAIKVLPSALLRVNNSNLYAGEVDPETGAALAPAVAVAQHVPADFKWHGSLNTSTNVISSTTLTSTTIASVQEKTKTYLGYLGIKDPEKMLDKIPYGTEAIASPTTYVSDIIDSAFIHFRVKFVTESRIGAKYLFLLAKDFYNYTNIPKVHTTEPLTDANGNTSTVTKVSKYVVTGDGYEYSLGITYITNSPSILPTHANYKYDRKHTSSDGYYYYVAEQEKPNPGHTAMAVANVSVTTTNSSGTTTNTRWGVSHYLANAGTSDVEANWLDIIPDTTGTAPDRNTIDLAGSGITLTTYSHTVPTTSAGIHTWTYAGSFFYHGDGRIEGDVVFTASYGYDVHNIPSHHYVTSVYAPGYDVYVTASDQILKVGTIYMKKSTTEIMFATIPDHVYENASITYGRSNSTGAELYKVHGVNAIERITDYGAADNTTFRYVSTSLNGSDNTVAMPIVYSILYKLNKFERHQLILLSSNLSMHTAVYYSIEKTWEQKLRAATINVIIVIIIVLAIISFAASWGKSATVALKVALVLKTLALAKATKILMEDILVPIVISNFGEDEAMVVLAVIAVAAAYYGGDTKADYTQFINQAALFSSAIDIMNTATAIVYESELLELESEKEDWAKADKDLTDKEQELEDAYKATFGTDTEDSFLVDLQLRSMLRPMEASAYLAYHDEKLESQFDCYDYDKALRIATSS